MPANSASSFAASINAAGTKIGPPGSATGSLVKLLELPASTVKVKGNGFPGIWVASRLPIRFTYACTRGLSRGVALRRTSVARPAPSATCFNAIEIDPLPGLSFLSARGQRRQNQKCRSHGDLSKTEEPIGEPLPECWRTRWDREPRRSAPEAFGFRSPCARLSPLASAPSRTPC